MVATRADLMVVVLVCRLAEMWAASMVGLSVALKVSRMAVKMAVELADWMAVWLAD